MTDSMMTDTIIDDIIHELLTQLPYRDIKYMYSYLENITCRHIFHLVKEYKRYRIKAYDNNVNYNNVNHNNVNHNNVNYNNVNYKFGSNMFVIILPAEGQVIITSLDIIENISGLSMWVTNSQHREKILQFDIYNYDMSTEPVKSPRIIVTDLPSHSLTLIKNICPLTSDTDIISIHELLMNVG